MIQPIWMKPRRNAAAAPDGDGVHYAVVSLSGEMTLPAGVELTLRVSAGTPYRLFCADIPVGAGTGGEEVDANGLPCLLYDTYTLTTGAECVAWTAWVQTPPASSHPPVPPCFFLAVYDGAGNCLGGTDTSWTVHPLFAVRSDGTSDYTFAPPPQRAVAVPGWSPLRQNPVPLAPFCPMPPSSSSLALPLTVSAGESGEIRLSWNDLCYGEAFLRWETAGPIALTVTTEQAPGVGEVRDRVFAATGAFYCTSPRAVSTLIVRFCNQTEEAAVLREVTLVCRADPMPPPPPLTLPDPALTEINRRCVRTLALCRAARPHLPAQDAVGDLGIARLVSRAERFLCPDPVHTRAELFSVAVRLRRAGGILFPASDALHFPGWLLEYYLYTGDAESLYLLRSALDAVISRFDACRGERGLISRVPDYGFLEDGSTDGYSLTAPPKYLGQTALCAQYVLAMEAAADLYAALRDTAAQTGCRTRASAMREAMTAALYDPAAGAFLGGLPTPETAPLAPSLPRNPARRRYLRQANVLAVLAGACPPERQIPLLRAVLASAGQEDFSPLFYPWLFAAVERFGLREEWGLRLVRRWSPLIAACPDGLPDRWRDLRTCFSPGTLSPACALPQFLSGFAVVEPGCRAVSLSPCLCGLESAEVTIPTPHGALKIRMRRGERTRVVAPPGIQVSFATP